MTITKNERPDETFVSHPFFKSLLTEASKVLSETAQIEIKGKGVFNIHENVRERSKEEDYLIRTFNRVTKLTDGYHRIALISSYLARELAGYKFSTAEFDSIMYHCSNLVVGIYALEDLSRILVAEVFQLGLRERDCKEATVDKNEWVQSGDTAKFLKRISSKVSRWKQSRNEFVHHGKSRSPVDFSVDDQIWFILTTDSNLAIEGEKRLLDGKQRADLLDIVCSQLRPTLEEMQQSFYSFIHELLTTLSPIFDARRERIRTLGW